MSTGRLLRRHERTISKAVLIFSLIALALLGSTLLFVGFLNSTPRTNLGGRGWQLTSEIRVVMDSTADWARIMFNDLYGGNDNGAKVVAFHSEGWLIGGNGTDDRIDAGRKTFIDIVYNQSVSKTGDIVGFFKGNNDFAHTRMYVDVELQINTNLRQVYVLTMLAGAGTTTFEFINKQSGVIIWQDTATGNSFTQYSRRWIPTEAFFAREEIQSVLVVVLVMGTIVTLFALNVLPLLRKNRRATRDSEAL